MAPNVKSRQSPKNTGQKYHVVPTPKGGWNVKPSGSDRVTRHFDTKKDAVSFGRQLAKVRGLSVVIHRSDGSIMEQRDYRRHHARSGEAAPLITAGFGGAKGLIQMSSDFDEPLSDFDDYR